MSIIFKPVSDFYKKFVHIEGENAYPWLDRAISYGLPTLGAVLWSALGAHKNNYDISKKTIHAAYWGLPAGLAFYGATQVGLTYLKPLVEVKESDGFFVKAGKNVADLSVKALDCLNNVVPYTIAYNMLPGTAGLNEVAAFRVMPEILTGVESDIKAAVNGTGYEGEVAGKIFASAAAGFGAVNLRDLVTGKVKPAALDENTNDKNRVEAYNRKAFDEKLTGALVESLSYPIFKKLLVTASYKSNEIEQDRLKGLMKELYKGSSLGKLCEITALQKSVFEGIPLFAAAELAPIGLEKISQGIAAIDLDFCGDHPEICSVALSTAAITASL